MNESLGFNNPFQNLDPHPPKAPPAPALRGNATWEGKKPPIFEKDFFQLQYDFCKALGEKTGNDLFQVIATHTLNLRQGAFESHQPESSRNLSPGITADNVVDTAYKNYLKKNSDAPLKYHPEHSRRFGCFSYDQAKDPGEIGIHFTNTEFDTVGPLDKDKIEARKNEIYDLLQDIKANHPETKTIKGNSWLYNLEAYKRLYPPSYTKEMYVNKNEGLWSTAATWGQFIDSDYKLRPELAQELMDRIKALPADASLSELFMNGSNVLPPLETEGPIADFYAMYGIETPEQKIPAEKMRRIIQDVIDNEYAVFDSKTMANYDADFRGEEPFFINIWNYQKGNELGYIIFHDFLRRVGTGKTFVSTDFTDGGAALFKKARDQGLIKQVESPASLNNQTRWMVASDPTTNLEKMKLGLTD